MQIAILLGVVAVCTNISMGFSGVCYPVIKQVAVRGCWLRGLEEQRRSAAFAGSGCWGLQH